MASLRRGQEHPSGADARTDQLPPSVALDSQSLLFGNYTELFDLPSIEISDDYYERGYATVPDIPDSETAAVVAAQLIAGLDTARLPELQRFAGKIDLAKADHIPVCDDIVGTEFQILHFDMGLPAAPLEDDSMWITHVGIYLPKSTEHPVAARSRLLPLTGLLAHAGLSASAMEEALLSYAQQCGDGWGKVNTGRLACFARVLDAVRGTRELAHEIDKPVGQWFRSDQRLDSASAYELEREYYASKGIDLTASEIQVALQPGELLLLDNARVVHGRIGHRREREIANFMFGVQNVTPADVAELRRTVVNALGTTKRDL